jgi:SAM-dependent methyltransferase
VSARGKWQGMMTIARLNWPYYAFAAVVLVAGLCGTLVISGFELRIFSTILSVGAGYFLFVSLSVSHLIYDRSDLYRWKWLDRALSGATRKQLIFCHSGFDEASPELREKLGDVGWLVLDHFDEIRMTEASILRARRMHPPTPRTLIARHDKWPVADKSADVVFGLLAIHELRSEAERVAWFSEARRCLRPDGRVVLVEHIRDTANFLAFGPGFLHFHSRASWRRSWEPAGFRCRDEFRVTPWVRVFVILVAS